MFELARRYIKTSLIFAALSTLLGMHMIAMQRLGQPRVLKWLPTAHGHLFLVGFVTMMIMGVAIWMFPRPKDARYSPILSKATYLLITPGSAIIQLYNHLASKNSPSSHSLPSLERWSFAIFLMVEIILPSRLFLAWVNLSLRFAIIATCP